MIKFFNLNNNAPFIIFKEKYDLAINANQHNIDAIGISSFSTQSNEVNSRYVNLKFVDGDKFIFFSNYNSPKAIDFSEHKQVSILIYWNKINTQIRLKANINKTPLKFNESYFKNREKHKNALAISSNQSKKISSYNEVLKKYEECYKNKNKNLNICPTYWGGFYFIPYYFEFWEGHDSRINKRDAYELKDENWCHYYLEP